MAGTINNSWRALMRFQLERARDWFARLKPESAGCPLMREAGVDVVTALPEHPG